jgi:hypothetical protein
VKAATSLLKPEGWLALMTTEGELGSLKAAVGAGFSWQEPAHLPGGERRLVVLGTREP